MSVYDLPIDRLCVTLKTMLKKIVTISIFLFFSLNYILLRKKNNFPTLLLLNICELSDFIGYKCLNLNRVYFVT